MTRRKTSLDGYLSDQRGAAPASGPFKVMLLGSSRAGKTSILTRIINDKFEESMLTTVGIDFRRITTTAQDGTKIRIQLWDTAGQERFKSMSKFYIRGADAAVIIFDVTDPKSFVDVSDWILGVVEECQSALGLNTMGIPKILVGNKVDLVQSRVVQEGLGKALGETYKMDYIETSAMTGENIDALVDLITETMHLSYKNGAINPSSSQASNTVRLKNTEDKGTQISFSALDEEKQRQCC